MRAALLIAGNFMREQRWYIVLVLLWVGGTAVAFGMPRTSEGRDDLLFYVRQQTAYGLALSLLMTSGAIFNERRSRRIVAVLAKAVERSEYLGGLLLGSLAISAVYCIATALAATWMASRQHVPVSPLWQFSAVLFCAMVLIAAFAAMFSTFLHPLITTVFAAGAIAAQLAIEHTTRSEYVAMGLVRALSRFDLGYMPPAIVPALLAIGEAALLWFLAARIFALRDIAVAVE